MNTDAPEEDLKNFSEIENINNYGKHVDLRLKTDSDPQQLVKQIMNKHRVEKFEITKPSLYDIFVMIAGDDYKEVENE